MSARASLPTFLQGVAARDREQVGQALRIPLRRDEVRIGAAMDHRRLQDPATVFLFLESVVQDRVAELFAPEPLKLSASLRRNGGRSGPDREGHDARTRRAADLPGSPAAMLLDRDLPTRGHRNATHADGVA